MKLDLNLKKSYFLPSETAEGSIHISCESPVMVKSLKLKFYKVIRMKIKKIDGTVPEVQEDFESIQREQFHSISENTELRAGLNVFPFSFLISNDENSTGIAKSYFLDSMCLLEHSFMVQGICETLDERIVVDKHISVINATNEKTTLDIKIKSSSFLCLFKRSLNYRIQTDKQWYSRGDNITIQLSPLKKIENPYVASIHVNVYQMIVFHKTNSVKSKLVTSFNATPISKNTFKFNFRVPMSLSPSISNENFTIQSILIFNINLYNGKQIKIRKTLFIGEAYFELPMMASPTDFENYVHLTRHLENEKMVNVGIKEI